MSTDDPMEGDSQDNGVLKNNGHEANPGDNGEKKKEDGKEGEGGKKRQDTEDREESEEEEETSVMMMQGGTTKKPETYNGNIPPPPTELYHGAQAQVVHMIDGKSINFIKISYKKSLKNMRGNLVSAGKLIQELLGCLQKSSESVMLAPLENKGNYID